MEMELPVMYVLLMEIRAGMKTDDVSIDALEMSSVLNGTTVYHTNVLGDGLVSTNDVLGTTHGLIDADTSLISAVFPRWSRR